MEDEEQVGGEKSGMDIFLLDVKEKNDEKVDVCQGGGKFIH